MMRILYYNWADYLDAERRGGGVSVYLRNLAAEFARRAEADVTFLCSGISYDPFDSRPRVERIRHGDRHNRQRRFDLVNSAVLAPGHHAFGLDSEVDHPETVRAFHDFLAREGPFDIVHFHNLEGLPAAALGLRGRFPNTRVLYTFHNYYPLCPQVNLWYRERANCLDFAGGSNCINCLIKTHDPDAIRRANAVAFVLKKRGIVPGSLLFNRAFSLGLRFSRVWLAATRHRSEKSRRVLGFEQEVRDTLDQTDNPLLRRVVSDPERFRRRRARITGQMNASCDRILCVSRRAGEVAARFGIDPALIETSYIGTGDAERWHTAPQRRRSAREDGTATLGYLGYMRRDKGFFFLLDALRRLPPDVARRIRLVVGAKPEDEAAMKALARASAGLQEVLFADGYSRHQLDTLLEGVDLGVIPSQWEDNLPQVAIEMHARGIPLLTSDLGGAQELGNTPQMVFRADSTQDFQERLVAFLDGKVDLDAYWRNARPPITMADHADQLLSIYRELIGAPAAS